MQPALFFVDENVQVLKSFLDICIPKCIEEKITAPWGVELRHWQTNFARDA